MQYHVYKGRGVEAIAEVENGILTTVVVNGMRIDVPEEGHIHFLLYGVRKKIMDAIGGEKGEEAVEDAQKRVQMTANSQWGESKRGGGKRIDAAKAARLLPPLVEAGMAFTRASSLASALAAGDEGAMDRVPPQARAAIEAILNE